MIPRQLLVLLLMRGDFEELSGRAGDGLHSR